MNLIDSPDTGRRRIAAVGMWDGVHTGHRFLIDFVRREGELRGLTPSVVTFSEHPLTVVRPEAVPPLLSDASTRLDLLNAAGVTDCILLDFNRKMRAMSASEFLGMLKNRYCVDTLIVGFNNRFGRDRLEGVEAYRAHGEVLGMEVIPAPEFKLRRTHVSSSAIRALLAEGKVDRAAELLGRPFTLAGTVVHGKQIGRTIGFPTANIEPLSPRLLVPAGGVYAVTVTTPDGVRRKGMANIGRRPTVDTTADAPVSIEVHIFDFAGDIYGRTLTMEFNRRLRSERTFANVEALRRQLGRDARAARR